MIERSHFAMAQQDVRYYLNGLLLEVSPNILRLVATDGHRLAFQELQTEDAKAEARQVIVPRKGVLELLRLLADSDAEVVLKLGANHIAAAGRDPLHLQADRRQVPRLPAGYSPRGRPDCDRRPAWCCAARWPAPASSSTTRPGHRLQLEDWILRAKARNSDQEEAEEEVEINYSGGP
jgi:DNA polymerase-3 subunit beta